MVLLSLIQPMHPRLRYEFDPWWAQYSGCLPRMHYLPSTSNPSPTRVTSPINISCYFRQLRRSPATFMRVPKRCARCKTSPQKPCNLWSFSHAAMRLLSNGSATAAAKNAFLIERTGGRTRRLHQATGPPLHFVLQLLFE